VKEGTSVGTGGDAVMLEGDKTESNSRSLVTTTSLGLETFFKEVTLQTYFGGKKLKGTGGAFAYLSGTGE